MFTLSTSRFSPPTSKTESVHQSNNISNNIKDSLLKLSHSSKELPHLNTNTLIEDNFCDIKEDKKNQYPVPFPRTKFLNINASRPMYEISPESRQCIEKNFNTTLPLKNHNTIITESTESTESTALSYTDDYYNKYKADKWTFKVNFRDKKLPVFASEVTAYQYELVAKEKGFYGELPQKIKRKDVTNEETLSLTEGKHGEELYNIFFEKTPNGKSKKRIMDNFGLRATAVRRVEHSTISFNTPKVITDFYIDIAPVNSKVTTK